MRILLLFLLAICCLSAAQASANCQRTQCNGIAYRLNWICDWAYSGGKLFDGQHVYNIWGYETNSNQEYLLRLDPADSYTVTISKDQDAVKVFRASDRALLEEISCMTSN